MLTISNLTVEIEGKKIINNLSLEVAPGQCHAIMGPNGAGKSSLAKVLAGDPSYEVVEGTITFNGEDLLEMEVEDRAKKGLLMSFQYPVEIPGVTNQQFLYAAYKEKMAEKKEMTLSEEEFALFTEKKAKEMGMDSSFLQRNVNEGFSGGEKKKNEMLQLAVLEPLFAILDETDSGLDIDSLKAVADTINAMRSPQKSFLLITHYQRLLDYVKPDKVHVMIEGDLVKSGDATLALELEEKGYDWLTHV